MNCPHMNNFLAFNPVWWLGWMAHVVCMGGKFIWAIMAVSSAGAQPNRPGCTPQWMSSRQGLPGQTGLWSLSEKSCPLTALMIFLLSQTGAGWLSRWHLHLRHGCEELHPSISVKQKEHSEMILVKNGNLGWIIWTSFTAIYSHHIFPRSATSCVLSGL